MGEGHKAKAAPTATSLHGCWCRFLKSSLLHEHRRAYADAQSSSAGPEGGKVAPVILLSPSLVLVLPHHEQPRKHSYQVHMLQKVAGGTWMAKATAVFSRETLHRKDWRLGDGYSLEFSL